MTAPLRIAAMSAAAALAAGAAWADLTAAQVWEDWQASATGFGQTVSVGAEEASGNTLTLRDVSIMMDGPEGGANATVSEIVMSERGDGSVSIRMSPEVPIDVTMMPADGEAGTFSMIIDQSQLDLVATGAPGAISYAYTAPSMSITMSEATIEDTPMDISMMMTLTGLAGSYDITQGDTRSIESDLSVDTLSMTLAGSDPSGSGDTFDIALSVASITSESSGSMSTLMTMTNLNEMIAAGLETSGTTTHGPMTYSVSGTSVGNAFTMTGKVEEGAYDVAIGEDGLSYGGMSRDVSVTLSGSEIPFPEITFGIAESGGRFLMPVGVSDEPQDIGMSIRIVGLTVSDMIWAMFDPMNVLPRDPATLVIDMAGKGNWLVDIFDPAVAEQPMDSAPGELHGMTVNELRLSLAGAELTGSGDFVMNNDEPIPQPSGTMNLQLVGGNALIDKLVQMGLLPADQAMGARMMLGLFARPGGGEDTLVSEITFQPDGSILANGQRIK
jgi:hypothetical protein